MNKKKAAKRIYKVTLDSFKTDLNADKYSTATGARRAASYLSETDKASALKLVAKHFGIGLDEPGPTGRKGARVGKKKVSKKVVKVVAVKPAASGLGMLRKKKLGRPRKNPVPEAVAAPPAAAAAPEAPKRRGRPPKVKVETVPEPVRTPELEAPKRQSRKGSRDTDHLDQIGLIGRAMGPLESALRILEKANQLANGQLNTAGFQEVADTATEAIKALRPHVARLAHQDPPPPPISSNGQADRPYDPALLEAAAHSRGIPLPSDDSAH